jgi:hypothetical protein
MDELKHTWTVNLDEKDARFTFIGGTRGTGKIFFLEQMVKFLQAELEAVKYDRDRWQSAALYYAERLGSGAKMDGDGNA